MFSTSDEILIWAKRYNKNKVYRLKLGAEVKERFVQLFNTGVSAILYDSNNEPLIPVPFETNYGVSAGEEHFIINEFNLPQEIRDAIDFPDTLVN